MTYIIMSAPVPLDRCPFCHGDKLEVHGFPATMESHGLLHGYVACTACGARGPEVSRGLVMECTGEELVAKVCARWNARPRKGSSGGET